MQGPAAAAASQARAVHGLALPRLDMKVAVIAFGTRGDVQPLAVLAYGLARSAPWCTEVALISHASHAHFAEPLLDAANTSSPDTPNSIAKGAAKFVPVNTPPVLWKGQSA